MIIGYRFCGGCNPRYQRTQFLEDLIRRVSDESLFLDVKFEFAKPGQLYPLMLSVNGCSSACCRLSDYSFSRHIAITPSSSVEHTVLSIQEISRGTSMWKDEYASKKLTAAEAVKHIPSHSRVVVGHACAEPTSLVEAMVNNCAQYKHVEIVHMVAMGKSAYAAADMQAHFRHNALFVGGSTRKAVGANLADYTPCFFFEIPRLFREGYLPVDVALIQVSPPDAHGYCSFGVSCDYTKSGAEAANIVIAEVNDQMPRVLGENFIHVSEIDYVVESSVPLIELPRPAIGEVERAIGEHCASLVQDGSTLQLGIGAIPDAVLLFLKDKKNLGIHSEMFSDGVLDLYEQGVITNCEKTLHPGKMIVTFIMGTKKLYNFIDDNPMVEMHPVDYVNDPRVIAENSKMVSINSCIEVDLMGQVSSESMGLRQFSGTGGQVDYVRGVSMSEDGISIIAMPATAKGGSVSKIVPILQEGSAVTTSRNDVHYVVTEFGIADLRGKTLKQRAQALCAVAHPDFRSELQAEIDRRFACTC